MKNATYSLKNNAHGRHDWFEFLTTMEVGDSKRLPLDLRSRVTSAALFHGTPIRTKKISKTECRVTRVHAPPTEGRTAAVLPPRENRLANAMRQVNYWKEVKASATDDTNRQKAAVSLAAWTMTLDRLSAMEGNTEETPAH